MAEGKPLLTINKFAGMGNEGLYMVERMSPRNINGQSVMTSSWNPSYLLSEDTSGYTGLTAFYGMTKIDWSSGSTLDDHIVGINATGGLFDLDAIAVGNGKGLIHTIPVGTGRSNFPDITTTTNENLLYTSAEYVGIGYKRTLTGGSSTTMVVADTNFTTLGVGTGTGVNKVYNITKGEEFTVTSVTTTGTTNDTLNFSAGSSTPAIGDIIMAFVDTKFDLGTLNTNAVRQMALFGDDYYILNNDYLATLNTDETTFSATAKQLPANTTAKSIGVNQGRILVGCDFRNKGKLVMWDGSTPGFLSILDTDKIPSAITPYSSGWIVMIGARMYYTDGYTLKLIARYPDTDPYNESLSVSYNGILNLDERIFLGITSGNDRQMGGTAIYNFGSGWELTPASNSSGVSFSKTFSFYHLISSIGVSTIVTSSQADSDATHANCVNTLLETGSTDYSMMYYVKLNSKTKVGLIELGLNSKYDKSMAVNGANSTVKVNYGDMRLPMWQFFQAGTGSTTTSIVNASGATRTGTEGLQLRFKYGNVGGERSYITSIANAGTGTETWTISPALSEAPQQTGDATVIVNNLKQAGGTETVNNASIPNELMFNVDDFYSDGIFIEVVFNSPNGAYLDLDYINIYG